jgi:hypothetical protein
VPADEATTAAYNNFFILHLAAPEKHRRARGGCRSIDSHAMRGRDLPLVHYGSSLSVVNKIQWPIFSRASARQVR